MVSCPAKRKVLMLSHTCCWDRPSWLWRRDAEDEERLPRMPALALPASRLLLRLLARGLPALPQKPKEKEEDQGCWIRSDCSGSSYTGGGGCGTAAEAPSGHSLETKA